MTRAALLVLCGLVLIAASEPQVPPEEAREHIVKAGETLGGIANRARVPRVLIAEANGLKPPYIVKIGQKLMIPRTGHHTVTKGETGLGIGADYGVPWSAIALASGIDPEAPIRVGQKLLIPTLIRQPAVGATTGDAAKPRLAWPLSGPIRRGFTPRGQGNHHDGLDITAKEGTAVRAAAAGTVIFAGREPEQFGNMVVVDHGGGWHTAYGFLSTVTVKQGEDVGQGERVGVVGQTGWAKGTELHFEVRRDNRPVDPIAELPKRK